MVGRMKGMGTERGEWRERRSRGERGRTLAMLQLDFVSRLPAPQTPAQSALFPAKPASQA
eukprot:2922999-Rhodomonas_salina.6